MNVKWISFLQKVFNQNNSQISKHEDKHFIHSMLKKCYIDIFTHWFIVSVKYFHCIFPSTSNILLDETLSDIVIDIFFTSALDAHWQNTLSNESEKFVLSRWKNWDFHCYSAWEKVEIQCGFFFGLQDRLWWTSVRICLEV